MYVKPWGDSGEETTWCLCAGPRHLGEADRWQFEVIIAVADIPVGLV